MEFISYFSILVISYLGLGAGIALALVAKEEIEPGKKYFKILQNYLVAAIVLITIYFLELPWLPWIFFIGITVLIFKFNNKRKKSFLIYLLLAVIFWMSVQKYSSFRIDVLFPIVSSLIFLLGFPTGTLLINIKKKNIIPVMISNIHYIIIGLILYLI